MESSGYTGIFLPFFLQVASTPVARPGILSFLLGEEGGGQLVRRARTLPVLVRETLKIFPRLTGERRVK